MMFPGPVGGKLGGNFIDQVFGGSSGGSYGWVTIHYVPSSM